MKKFGKVYAFTDPTTFLMTIFKPNTLQLILPKGEAVSHVDQQTTVPDLRVNQLPAKVARMVLVDGAKMICEKNIEGEDLLLSVRVEISAGYKRYVVFQVD